MQEDGWFLVGIFAFAFLIWAATGGPARPLSWSGPTLAKPEELGGGTYLGLPRAPFSITTTRSGSTERESSTLLGRFGISGDTIRGFPLGTPSPYRDTIRLTNQVVGASSTDPRREYVRFEVRASAAAPVPITGWQIASEVTGNAARIPTGTAAPTLGIVNQQQPLVLQPGERALVHTGRSPIGTSFRENVCTGYLDEFQAFVPRLPKTCPTPIDEFKRVMGPYYQRETACLEYLKSVNRCETVTYVSRRDAPESCRAFALKHLNYNGCVVAHRDDATFAGKTWHIYLGRADALWRARNEVIKLLDTEMHTVGAFAY